MKISYSGFQDISNFNDNILVIEEWVDAIVFDRWSNITNIQLEKNAKLQYFGYFSDGISVEKHFETLWEWSDANINCFIHGKGNDTVNAKILWEVAKSKSKIDIDAIAIVSDAWNVHIDWIIQINKGVEKVEGFLDETNIFLWDKWSVRGFPTLLVRSNDVKAGHGCNIEKISDEKLFYLRSRGINKNDSVTMMIQSYVETIFSNLESVDNQFHNNLIEEIIEKI